MKKVCLSLLLACLFLVSGNANNIEGLPAEGPKITVTIEIGKRPSCILAWAICRIDVGGGALAGTAETFPAGSGSGSGGGGGGSWRLVIPRENFAKYYPDLLVKLDGKSTVTFEETYIAPPELKKALGSMKDLVIQGNVAYPLKFENGEYVITFSL